MPEDRREQAGEGPRDGGVPARVERVQVRPQSLERFRDVLPAARWRRVEDALARAGSVLTDRVVWNVNSTARGGGVAEMLRSLIGYARGAGVDARWMTISGDARFFEVTKRLHNRLHGSPGDGGPLGTSERAVYEAPLRRCADALLEQMRSRDLVVLHDPQTAPLVPLLADSGARIAWRSHIGQDTPNALALEAWRFLLPYVQHADVCIFSRQAYAWGGIETGRLAFIHPSIDAFSVKNQELDPDDVLAILAAAGILDGAGGGPAKFSRADETPGLVQRRTQLVEAGRLRAATQVAVQVSRWDRLKDPLGVVEGFAAHVAADSPAHLVLAGAETGAVADDPEGAEVLAEVEQAWTRLDPGTRERVHLACLPMEDAEENAVIVNALQRHASVVCQKSIAEGFGLTVAEAMWKARPVVATRVGGIQDQIVHGVSGYLIDDPRDLAEFGAAITAFLNEPATAAKVGARARRRARDKFLGPDHLIHYLRLFERLLKEKPSAKKLARPV
ncbi:MAG: glycosyltransferase [Actinobacteria bacterium]|nr:MAG: glycosyltransferase [Actinomycetota bacterium]